VATVTIVNGQVKKQEELTKEEAAAMHLDHKAPKALDEKKPRELKFDDVPIPMAIARDIKLSGINIKYNVGYSKFFFDISIDASHSSNSLLKAWFTTELTDDDNQVIGYVPTVFSGFSAKYYEHSGTWSVYMPCGKSYFSKALGKEVYPEHITGPFSDLLRTAAIFVQKKVATRDGETIEAYLPQKKLWTKMEARLHFYELMTKAYNQWVRDVIDDEDGFDKVCKAEPKFNHLIIGFYLDHIVQRKKATK